MPEMYRCVMFPVISIFRYEQIFSYFDRINCSKAGFAPGAAFAKPRRTANVLRGASIIYIYQCAKVNYLENYNAQTRTGAHFAF